MPANSLCSAIRCLQPSRVKLGHLILGTNGEGGGNSTKMPFLFFLRPYHKVMQDAGCCSLSTVTSQVSIHISRCPWVLEWACSYQNDSSIWQVTVGKMNADLCPAPQKARTSSSLNPCLLGLVLGMSRGINFTHRCILLYIDFFVWKKAGN